MAGESVQLHSENLSLNTTSSNRTDDYDLLASEIQDKTGDDVARYYPVFRKKWKELAGASSSVSAEDRRVEFSNCL